MRALGTFGAAAAVEFEAVAVLFVFAGVRGMLGCTAVSLLDPTAAVLLAFAGFLTAAVVFTAAGTAAVVTGIISASVAAPDSLRQRAC
jgi:hypothetical protein